jgi:hypothetical protein
MWPDTGILPDIRLFSVSGIRQGKKAGLSGRISGASLVLSPGSGERALLCCGFLGFWFRIIAEKKIATTQFEERLMAFLLGIRRRRR